MPAELTGLHPSPWTEPFWDAARQHRLIVPRCRKCNTFRMPPGPFCHVCRTQDVDQVELTGRGTVFTSTITRHALIPAMAEAVPFVIAVVELEDAPGARMVSNVVGCAVEDVRIGMAVQVAWDDIDDRVTIPRFIPAT
jgi:hypothetical protein